MSQYKKWILTGVVTSSISLLCADQPNMNKSSSQQQQQQQMNGPAREITPLAEPVAREGGRFFFTADFIYWQARQDNMGIGVSGDYIMDTAADGRIVAIGDIKAKSINYQYRPGFKVGAGVVFDHDGWDIYSQYTWLQQNHQTRSTGDSAITSGPNFAIATSDITTFTGVGSTSAYATLHFNNMDLELGRHFYISRRLAMRPHFGVKGTWQNQRFNTSSAFVGTGDVDPTSTGNISQRQTFWGVGLRAGLNTEWHMTRCFSIYADVAAAELYGQFYDRVSTTTAGALGGVLAPAPAYLRQYYHNIRPVLEMGMGFRWETTFADDEYHFLMQAGWEQQVWFSQNQFLSTFGAATGSGGQDLTLQGLDVKIGFAF